jgi:hypothetical protein
MTFNRVEGATFLPMTGLWFELPTVKNDDVRRVFGSGLASQDRMKYSQSIVIEHAETGTRYSLYKSYGVWRVGGSKNCSEEVAIAIKRILGVSE